METSGVRYLYIIMENQRGVGENLGDAVYSNKCI